MKYVCDICGFIYDEAAEGPIPDDLHLSFVRRRQEPLQARRIND